MSHRTWLLAVALAAPLTALAQAITPPGKVESLIKRGILQHVATAGESPATTITWRFLKSDFESQEQTARWAFEYVLLMNPKATKITLVNSSGQTVGTFSKNKLTLSGS